MTQTMIQRIIIVLLLSCSAFVWADSSKLIAIQNKIKAEYPKLSHIENEALSDLIKNHPGSYVLFDVREKQEYEVSHLNGAYRVDPGVDFEEFQSLFGEQVAGKKMIFYCSVGRRSSYLANKISKNLSESEKANVINLEHGIFGWHNEDYDLVLQSEETEFVHPYNRRWGKLIDRKELIRYSVD